MNAVSNIFQRPLGQYLMAFVALVIATLVRWLLDPVLGDHLPYVTYFGAIAFIAWRYGFGPSLFALVAGWWAADFFFYSPRYVWFPLGNEPIHIVSTTTYFMVGLFIIAVNELMRRAQRQAEQAHAMLRVTFASIGDAVITTDAQGRLTSLNATAETLTGWNENEAVGRPLNEIFRVINKETRKPVESPVERVLAEGLVVGLANHTALIGKDGTERPIDDSAAPIRDAEGNILGAVLIFRDVTQQRQTELILRENESRKSAMLNSAMDAIISMDHEGRFVEFNPAAERMFGYLRAEVIGKPLADMIIPEPLRDKHRKGLANYLLTGKGPVLNQLIELPASRADGTEFSAELAIVVIPGIKPPMFTAFLRDITERKRIEQVLAESEAYARSVFESSPDCVKIVDFNGHLERMNTNGQCVMEIDDFKTVHGKYWPSLWPTEVRSQVEAAIAEARAGRTVRFSGLCPTAKGTPKWWDVMVTAVPGASGRLVASSRDITDRKQAEERERLLAHELAHRGKNLLAVVQAIVSRSLSGERSLAEAREVLIRRIQALARSQSMPATSSLAGASVHEIVRGEIEAFSDRVEAVGPEVTLNAKAAQTFALLVHELATNASKHGALSRPDGRVAIHWSTEGAGAKARFKFQWQEQGGPTVTPPTRHGFGRVLIEKAVAQDLDTQPKIRFAPEGLSYEIDAPLSAIVMREDGDGPR